MTVDDPEQPSKSYQDRISEAVKDGSGCTETWEELSSNRRGFLKAGAGTLAVATLGAGNAFAESAAASTPSAMQSDTEYQELQHRQAKEIQESFTNRPEFHTLTSKARQRGFQINTDKSVIGELTSEGGEDRILMSTPLDSENAQQAYITMGANASGALVIATLEYKPSDEKLTTIDALNGGSSRTVALPDPQSDTVNVDQDGMQAASTIGCNGCKGAVALICEIHCGVSTAFVCGVLTGAGYIAGGLCFSFTQYACATIAILGCGVNYGRICRDMGHC